MSVRRSFVHGVLQASEWTSRFSRLISLDALPQELFLLRCRRFPFPCVGHVQNIRPERSTRLRWVGWFWSAANRRTDVDICNRVYIPGDACLNQGRFASTPILSVTTGNPAAFLDTVQRSLAACERSNVSSSAFTQNCVVAPHETSFPAS